MERHTRSTVVHSIPVGTMFHKWRHHALPPGDTRGLCHLVCMMNVGLGWLMTLATPHVRMWEAKWEKGVTPALVSFAMTWCDSMKWRRVTPGETWRFPETHGLPSRWKSLLYDWHRLLCQSYNKSSMSWTVVDTRLSVCFALQLTVHAHPTMLLEVSWITL